MEINLENYTFYIKPGYTDMRKQSRSLALYVQNEMELNPFEKSVFIFCGRSRRILKAICWNGNGWLELTKRLESLERFSWPMSEEAAREVSLEQIIGTLKGYDMWKAFSELRPEFVG